MVYNMKSKKKCYLLLKMKIINDIIFMNYNKGNSAIDERMSNMGNIVLLDELTINKIAARRSYRKTSISNKRNARKLN